MLSTVKNNKWFAFGKARLRIQFCRKNRGRIMRERNILLTRIKPDSYWTKPDLKIPTATGCARCLKFPLRFHRETKPSVIRALYSKSVDRSGNSRWNRTLEFQTMLQHLQRGQYQMTTATRVGGNQDPIFLRDLFASSEIPANPRFSQSQPLFKQRSWRITQQSD